MNLALGWSFFERTFSVGLNSKIFVMDGGGGKRDHNMYQVLFTRH